MSNIKITVFTPTYNRAHLLKRVFESLQNQTDKNFIWQIVDDGSKDDTRNVVEDFKKSSSFEIQYLYKKNGGKHTAHNFGVENCKTDYFLILDSDDWLSEDAIEVVNKKIKKVDNLENISGIIGKKFCIDNSSSQAEMPKNIEFASGIELYEKYGLEGETLRIYKTSVLKEYLFPVIKNEKFVSENVVFDKIDQKYKMYVIPEKLYFYEYLDDGYSRNIDKIHLQSPIGYAISLKSSAETALFLKNKIKWTILYIIWCQKTNCINGYDKFNNKLLYILLLPIVKLFTIFKFPKFFFRAFNDKSLKRKNALIITLYGNFNFGNKLQNYALQEKIKDFGFNVQTLAIKYRYDSIFKNIKVVLGGLLKRIRLSKIDIKKEQEFLKFNKEHLFYKKGMCSTNPIIKKNIEGFDYYVYGSDQIWNPSSLGNSKLLLGYLTEKEKNLTYAASFGVAELPENLKEQYKRGFKNFKYISIREIEGKKIIDELSNNDAVVSIDPTMLLTTDEWDKVMKKPEQLDCDKYILNCFLGDLSNERKTEIEKFAKENDCKILNIFDKNSSIYNIGPSEFLYLEKNAFLICTDSFHSCVFALLYNKPFVVFEREAANLENMSSRIDTLINKFKLKNRKYNGHSITKDNLEHDYSEAYKILEEERIKSANYLKKALNMEGKNE